MSQKIYLKQKITSGAYMFSIPFFIMFFLMGYIKFMDFYNGHQEIDLFDNFIYFITTILIFIWRIRGDLGSGLIKILA